MDWETLFYNMQRGGLTRPGVTAEEEKGAIDRAASLRPDPPPSDPPRPGAPPTPPAKPAGPPPVPEKKAA
jgi:hypothetical protein